LSENVVWHPANVTTEDRAKATGGTGATVWLTGLSGSGKSTIARAAEVEFIGRGRAAYVLDGDNLRHGLNADLGFSEIDRTENVRRVSSVAELMADAGLVVLVAVIAPFAADRDRVKMEHERKGLSYLEVFVDAPLEVCEQRDPKGLYARARNGETINMTGLDSRYEAPVDPWLRLDSARETSEELARALVNAVFALGGDGSGTRVSAK
jgi:bifunctional enzyme CysN/CysC